MRLTIVALVGVLGCLGCKREPAVSASAGSAAGSGQAFRDGVEVLCSLPDHVPDTGEHYEKRLAAVGIWADQHVTNPEVRELGDLKGLGTHKDQLVAAVHKAGLASCKLLDNGMALQSFEDAVHIICDVATLEPDETKRSAYFTSHLLNPVAIRLFAELANADAAGRARILRGAMARAKLPSCALVDHATDAIAVPTVTAQGLDALDPASPMVSITKTAIVVEGTVIVPVTNGALDAKDLDGAAIPKLGTFLTALAAAKHPTTLGVAIDPSTPYRVVLAVLVTSRQAKFQRFAIVARDGAALKSIPLVLPSGAQAGSGDVGMFVTLNKDRALLWSLSGQEGTLPKPKLDVAQDVGTSEIPRALLEILGRRWATGKRPASDRAITVQADAAVTAQRLVEMLAAVRTSIDGKELFPDVRLASGFE